MNHLWQISPIDLYRHSQQHQITNHKHDHHYHQHKTTIKNIKPKKRKWFDNCIPEKHFTTPTTHTKSNSSSNSRAYWRLDDAFFNQVYLQFLLLPFQDWNKINQWIKKVLPFPLSNSVLRLRCAEMVRRSYAGSICTSRHNYLFILTIYKEARQSSDRTVESASAS